MTDISPHDPTTLRTGAATQRHKEADTVTMEPQRDRPRIFRFTIRSPEGRRTSGLVKCPLPEHDVADSVFGLEQKLTQLTLERQLAGFSLMAPTKIPHRKHQGPCQCFSRWPIVLEAAIVRLQPA